MRTLKTLVIAALLISMGGIAFAELQNVEIGGKLRIRGNWFDMDRATDASFVEQRALLNVKADFTSDVSVFIELDDYSIWGEDFRSLYLTGADARSNSSDDVELYQAYIDAKNLWGTPLSMRVGRQELVFGNEFLLGNNDTSAAFTGLSYDALRLTFANDMVNIDAFAAKLAETAGDWGEDDINLYGVYGSYIGIEDVVIDAYWLFLQDDSVLIGDDIDIHTVGLRGAGTLGAFDFDLNVAYQFGEVDGQPSACPLGFGEADVDYDALAVDAQLGYTFDVAWQPRVFAGFAWYDGGDPDESHWSNDADLPFNRLFSDIEYSEFLDNVGSLSNVMVYSLGVQVMPTEAVALKLVGKYLDTDQERLVYVFPCHVNVGDTLGWELGLYADYHYSEDLVIRAGYAHFFGDDGLEGSFVLANGLAPVLADDDDDYNYLFIEAEIAF
ncbi:MAG: alginate export family protein [Candidatus Hydrogenedentes bacterium]|nr:alginate export family protein [Candidatus Hydrogenedentota bacterium]